ncbi:MAG: DUF5615 family PIN-like protein [Bryobacteraceae bacterium]|nr:DUF5615 family PIN-like protein [Bryobacteraceae bacterium]
MKFKIDENLPSEFATMLNDAGFDADTVADEGIAGAADSVVFQHAQAEHRAIITLDLDFSNLQTYPCSSHAGIIVLRTQTQDKAALLAVMRRLIRIFLERLPMQQLWIVEKDRIRVRTAVSS